MRPYKGRQFDPNKPMKIYRNLHRKSLSIKQDGLVVAHTEPGDELLLGWVFLDVNETGRQRVLREKRKNVHAWISAQQVVDYDFDVTKNWPQLTYNPYKYDNFVDVDTEQPVLEAKWVAIDNEGKMKYRRS